MGWLTRIALWGVLLSAGTAVGAQTVSLTATPTSGISPLSVTLTWSSTGFAAPDTCSASGAWSGSKALAGSEVIAGLTSGNKTFTLTCGSTTGSATLSWTAPTQNTDGSTISATPPGALAGFKLYHSTTAAGVTTATPIVVNDKAATSYTITGLPVGVRYYAATAFNTENLESDFSGTVNNTIVAPSASATAAVTVNVRPKPPALKSVIAVAYEVKQNKWGDIELGRKVASLKVGTECVDNPVQTDSGEYYEIDRANVTLTKEPRSNIIVTRCQWGG